MMSLIGGWMPYGPYTRDKSDPFGWIPDPVLPLLLCSMDESLDEEFGGIPT